LGLDFSSSIVGTLGDVHELERVASEFDMAFGDTPVEDVCVLGSPAVSRARFGRSRQDGAGTVLGRCLIHVTELSNGVWAITAGGRFGLQTLGTWVGSIAFDLSTSTLFAR
jgi:hypothetical protein